MAISCLPSPPDKYEEFRTQFAWPAQAYSLAPFWFWNGALQPEELVRQVDRMKESGIDLFGIHARRGMQIDYMSHAWLDRVRVAVEAAAERNMRVYLYDEDNWPSGYAGGAVLRCVPEGRAKHLRRRLVTTEEIDVNLYDGGTVRLIAAVSGRREADGSIRNSKLVTDEVLALREAKEGGAILPLRPGDVSLIFEQALTDWHAAYGKEWYTDLLDPGVVQAFIDTTHERYGEVIGEHLGNTVFAVFTDEPGFYNNFWDVNRYSVPWTTDFADVFAADHGYRIEPHLNSLWEGAHLDDLQVRHDYWDTLSRLFRDRYFGALQAWCHRRGMALMGHHNNEEWVTDHIRYGGGSFFRGAEKLDIPGIDLIGAPGNYRRAPSAIPPRLLGSVTHVQGKRRAMSESFGDFTWNLTIADMHRYAARQMVRGVNFLVPHAFYYSIDGDRRDECPPSEFFNNIWWEDAVSFHHWARRASLVASAGQPVAPIALLYPAVRAWETTRPSLDTRKEPEIDARYRELMDKLFRSSLGFDLVDDDALRTWGPGHNPLGYRISIIPEATIFELSTLVWLKSFVEQGGTLVADQTFDRRCPKQRQEKEHKKLMEYLFGTETKPHTCRMGEGAVIVLASVLDDSVAYVEKVLDGLDRIRITPKTLEVTCLWRRLDDGGLFWLNNESNRWQTVQISLPRLGTLERWDLLTGEIYPQVIRKIGERELIVSAELAPYEDILFVAKKNVSAAIYVVSSTLKTIREFDITGDTVNLLAFTEMAGEMSADFILDNRCYKLTGTVQEDWFQHPVSGPWRASLGDLELTELVSWSDLGYPTLSGTVAYETTCRVEPFGEKDIVLLDLGDVRESVRAYVDEEFIGRRAWYPYTLDLTEAIRGKIEFRLRLEVTNTLANEYHEQDRISGLLGPVSLRRLACVRMSN